MSEQAAVSGELWWRVALRVLITAGLFGLLAPVIGALITIAGYLIFGFHVSLPGQAGWALLAGIGYGIWLEYPVGILPSAAVGVLVGLRDTVGPGTDIAFATIVGAAAGILWGLLPPDSPGGFFSYLVVASSIIATLACWKLTRWVRRVL